MQGIFKLSLHIIGSSTASPLCNINACLLNHACVLNCSKLLKLAHSKCFTLCGSPLEGARHIQQTQPLFILCAQPQRFWVNHRMNYSPQIKKKTILWAIFPSHPHWNAAEYYLRSRVILNAFLPKCIGKVIVVLPFLVFIFNTIFKFVQRLC